MALSLDFRENDAESEYLPEIDECDSLSDTNLSISILSPKTQLLNAPFPTSKVNPLASIPSHNSETNNKRGFVLQQRNRIRKESVISGKGWRRDERRSRSVNRTFQHSS
ncbi:hypothetical protein TNCV_766041 [Trichonephila clavipes]|nr:hypothetical protein TNCV_766041 [Trichonephila clavipes]